MIVAKEFKWEAAHRLPRHNGKCKHLHGHSYKMVVEFEGEPDETGMVMDFNVLKSLVQPIVDQLDHTTIIAKSDVELRETFLAKSWKYFEMEKESTAENLCALILDFITKNNLQLLRTNSIRAICIKISETASAYASLRVEMAAG
ncbi:MAG TPA: 6-carboxytetrahydropterin synthase QueD [Bacteroidia bacterium]|nr:6-carboxytetrahydropterin synthase QueD [Bacteroidia bacterium]HRH07659.1 6-carboxytetrahydropterin synthase QueD [Bacteroidia bacterium]HRH62426.1 6-carboxytetrahydropterin synthase QueD [Bacteroidia bacterium]